MPDLRRVGLLGGFALGAVGYIVCGIIDRTDIAELVMILCILAGPSIAWIVGRVTKEKNPSDDKQTDVMNNLK